MPVQIYHRAVVSPKAELADGVRVEPFAVIEDEVVIGENTVVGPHVCIYDGARIGKECKFFPGASISAPPQDLKYKGEATLLEVGDKTVVREYVTLNKGTAESGKTAIGSNVFIMAYAHIGHDCRVGNNIILANCVALGGFVEIEDWVIIGGLSPVHQFTRIGAHAMIGGHFRVTKDVPPYILAGHQPLIFEGLNRVGLKRRGFSQDTIDLLDKAYYILYRSNLNVSQAVARIKEEMELTPEIQSVLSFIEKSKRGIISKRYV